MTVLVLKKIHVVNLVSLLSNIPYVRDYVQCLEKIFISVTQMHRYIVLRP